MMMRCPWMIAMGLGWALLHTVAPRLPAADAAWVARYERVFVETRQTWTVAPTNSVIGWQFARACYDRAEFATNSAQKIDLARQGIAAARASINLQPKIAAAHYYLAMNLGQLADATRSLGGLKLVSEMEREFKSARAFDAAFDYAGPDRSLGLLYRDAPGWPISVGSRAKARQHLEKACELSKDYPDNRLTLVEAWLKWGERKKVLPELKSVAGILADARPKLAGEEWASAWADWDKRWREILSKSFAEPVRPSESPKGGR